MKRTPFTVHSTLLSASLCAIAACSPSMSMDVVAPFDAPNAMGMDSPTVDVVADLGALSDRPTTMIDTGPQCPAESALCDGTCVNLQTDRGHCGSCGTRCGAGLVCSAGRCAIECVAGLMACADPVDSDAGTTGDAGDAQVDNRTCVDLETDSRHCGACSMACAVGESCVASRCARGCTAGLTLCGSACRDTQNDPNHCGMCGQSCPSGAGGTAVCNAGRCGIVCAPGVADCNAIAADGCETMLNTVNHCRACGIECRFANASSTCEMSGCALGACNAGFANCNMNAADGCETDTRSDRSHCGACGRVCAAGEVCSMGACALECAAGLTNCNGSCRDRSNDIAHCGGCGVQCAAGANQTPVCASSRCTTVCAANFDDCNRRPADGCESNLTTDVNNCGSCGRACSIANGTAGCQASACTIASCAASFRNCNNNVADGCETNITNDTNHCGGCGIVCAPGASCFNGNCLESSPAPVVIPNSAGCSLLRDDGADQIDVSPEGVIYVAMHCYAARELRVSVSNDFGHSFSAARAIPALDWPGNPGVAAAVYARSQREVLLHIGTLAARTQFLRSTDQGLTWTAPVESGRPYTICANGAGLSLIATAGPFLYSAWSDCSNVGRIASSGNNGMTWQLGDLPALTLAGGNVAPNLFTTQIGELIYADELNRTVYVQPAGFAGWRSLGSLGTASLATDFAAGGPWIYAVGTGNTVTRGVLSNAAFAMGSLTVQPYAASGIVWSVDADPSGNLSLATQNGATVNLYSWRAGTATMDAPVTLVLPNAGPNMLATAAFTLARASATAIMNNGFVGGSIAVHVQRF